MPRPEKIRLGEILVRQKLISEEQLEQSLSEQSRSGRKLGRIFIEGGFVSEEDIAQALARQLGIPYIDLRQYPINPVVTKKLPEAQARRLRAIVLEDRGSAYLVGMADPTDLFAYDELVRLLGRDIDLAVLNEIQLTQVTDRVYRRTEEITGLAHELEEELGEPAIDVGALSPGAEDAPVVRLIQSIFEDATQVRASDIHIEPMESRLVIRFRIDGIMHLQTEADRRITSALALRLKLMAGLDISEKRLPQDGRFAVKVKDQQIDVRLSTLPTQYGESVVMRLLSQAESALSLDRLGMPADMLEKFRGIIRRPNGMVLVTGPTGSGKTTTLYAALAEINSPEVKIITVEDPVEYRLQGINQVQVNEKIELTFARVLRSVLRQDPDIVLVGEMRDGETAQIGLRASMTGHLVLSTLHTNDAASTPVRLLDMGAPPYMVASSLHVVVAQRLVRLACPECARPHNPSPQETEWLRLEPGYDADRSKFLHGRGCNQCNGLGYAGRVAVYEMLEMTSRLTDAAGRGDTAAFMQLAHEQMRGGTLRNRALALAASGRTSLAEAMRVSSQADD
jgi:MSHA biogenesis protein MshE